VGAVRAGMASPRRKRLLTLAALVFVGAMLWFWPARRNYYFRRDLVVRHLDLAYTSANDPKRQLDLYLPPHPRPPGAPAAPVVVFVHGGYWSPLDRRWLEPLTGAFGNVGVALARHGMFAAIIGYRQYPLVQRGDDSLDDIAAAIRFVRDSCPSWGCDPGRTFVVGHSAGGHLAALLAMDPRILLRHGVAPEGISGFVSIDGIFDLAASLPAFKPAQADVVRQLFGPDDANLAAHSPISYARAKHPPLLFVDSTGDQPVCRDGFHRMKARMTEMGSPAAFVELAGLGHNEAVLRIGTDADPVMPSLLAFVR
jgi:acetyl esterase/lipase